jgi:MFS-type transporter involved in bile tolerance (Atg22 family)
VYILFTVGAASMSPFPGLCRVLMTDLIPATYTSTVMSLDAIIETLTAWMGPLVVALILDNAGSLRWVRMVVGIVTVEPTRRTFYIVRYSWNLGPLT